jgi:SAM-dependent methyltransferase
VNDELLTLLTCPVCRDGDLLGLAARATDATLTCSRCDAKYPIRDGVPILLPADCDLAGVHDELDHAHGHKHRQAGYFDHAVAEEFEIVRPHGTPRAHRWLLSQKLNRAVAHVPDLRRATVVDACCGSGMEAEFLARRGARVLAVDLSEGAARRARARARRFDLDYFVVVGDVERLPVRTGAAEVAFVHDGLHHLADPLVGVRELARVGRRAISITEPADATLTQMAVRFGLATNEEEAGNEVRRLRPEQVRRELAAAGFSTRYERYLMYYGHEPGRATQLLSTPALFLAFRAGLGAADLVAGRWGNKLCVTGVRAGQRPSDREARDPFRGARQRP